MRLGCVILNYNDAGTTLAQAERLIHYDNLDHIVLVDNCSSDHSLEQLKSYVAGHSRRVTLLTAKSNGGYGSGNNLGIHYCYEMLHMSHVLIANPDANFDRNCVQAMREIWDRYPMLAAVAPCMNSGEEAEDLGRGWPLRSWREDLLEMGPFSRRMWKGKLRYPLHYYGKGDNVLVDVVAGSLLMVDAERMAECGGFDPHVFLYNEENILAWKLKHLSYETRLLLTVGYDHNHGESVGKTYHTMESRLKLRFESAWYYYRHYLKISRIQEAITAIWFRWILWEIRLAGKCGRK